MTRLHGYDRDCIQMRGNETDFHMPIKPSASDIALDMQLRLSSPLPLETLLSTTLSDIYNVA